MSFWRKSIRRAGLSVALLFLAATADFFHVFGDKIDTPSGDFAFFSTLDGENSFSSWSLQACVKSQAEKPVWWTRRHFQRWTFCFSDSPLGFFLFFSLSFRIIYSSLTLKTVDQSSQQQVNIWNHGRLLARRSLATSRSQLASILNKVYRGVVRSNSESPIQGRSRIKTLPARE